MDFSTVSTFLVSLAIGGLVGLEREIYQQRSNQQSGFAGIRTYLMVAFAGSISAYFIQQDAWRAIAYILFLGIVALIVAAYYVSAVKGYIGMTTEISVLLVFSLSMLSMFEEYQKYAVVLAIILAIILSLKEHLHKLAKSTKQVEWFKTLTFIFMAFVILPLLPNEHFSVFGVAESFNPYRTWLMVVFVSGISYIGYFLTKVVGGSYGIGLTGLLGGLVSSTAVTESMAVDSKKNPRLINSYALGAVAASVIMGIRVLFEVWVVDASMLSLMAVPLVIMTIVGAVIALRWFGKGEIRKRHVDLDLGSPFTLKPAILFGILYSFVVFVSHALMSLDIGSYGFVLLAMVAGLVDVDAITLTMAGMFSSGSISGHIAWMTIVVSVVSNAMFKICIARMFGSNEYVKKVAGALLIMAVAGVASLLIFAL